MVAERVEAKMSELTTGEAIRAFCQKCVNSNRTSVIEDCGGGGIVAATGKVCALFKYRLKGKGNLRVIRTNCAECMGNSWHIIECTTTDCDLFDFRLGLHPRRIGGAGRPNNFLKQRENSR